MGLINLFVCDGCAAREDGGERKILPNGWKEIYVHTMPLYVCSLACALKAIEEKVRSMYQTEVRT